MITRVFILLYIIPSFIFSQEYKVYDRSENTIIPEVNFYNNKHVVSSNNMGIVDLSLFSNSETISVSHISYIDFSFSKNQIHGNKIFLTSKNYNLNQIEIKERLTVEEEKTKLIKIDNDEILSSLSMNPSELIEKTTPITIQRSQAGGGSPNIRGFEANRILLIIDGVKLNNTIYRSGHLQSILSIDPFIIDNLSVLHGPASVFYGSGALGGAIVINTILPEKTHANKNLFVQQYETSSSSSLFHFHSSYKSGKISLLSSVSIKKYGNIKMGKNRFHGYEDWGIYKYATNDNEQLFGEYNQADLSQKIHIPINNNSSFSLSSQFSTTSNINRFDKLNDVSDNLPKYKSWYYGPQKRFLQSFNHSYYKNSIFFDKISSSISYQKIEESRISQLYNSSSIITRIENLNVFDGKTEFIKNIKNYKLRYGISGRSEYLNSNANNIDENTNLISYASTRYPENGSSAFNISSFLLCEQKINSKLNWFNGFRYDYENISMDFSENIILPWGLNTVKNKNANFSFSSSVSLDINKNDFISYSFFNAFRNPNIDDLGKVFSKNSGFLVVPNPNLKSEKILSSELIYSKKNNFRKIEISFFYSNLKDAIQKRPFIYNGSDSIIYDGEIMRTIANTNIQKASMSGFSLSFTEDFSKNLSFSLNASYVHGKSSDGLPLSHIPPLSIQNNLDIKVSNLSSILIYSNYNSWKRSEDFDLNGVDNLEEATIDGTPSWYTLNLKYSVKIQESLFSISCENIFDAHYKTFASGISANGRNFILNLQSNL